MPTCVSGEQCQPRLDSGKGETSHNRSNESYYSTKLNPSRAVGALKISHIINIYYIILPIEILYLLLAGFASVHLLIFRSDIVIKHLEHVEHGL